MQQHFGLVIDAGSSGTRMRVFTWTSIDHIREAALKPRCLRVKPGLSSYADRTELAARQLMELVKCAQGVVPPPFRRTAPLFFRATAGFRLLQRTPAHALLDTARQTLSGDACPFAFVDARVLSGDEEAIFGWMSINFLLGHLDGGDRDGVGGDGGSSTTETRRSRVGWLDLGGASAQIAYEIGDDEEGEVLAAASSGANLTELVTLPSGETVRLFRRSYLHYGREEAFR